MTQIHPTSLVSEKAILGQNVKIGPYCTVGDQVILGDNVELISHVCIDGWTEIGAHTKIYPFAAIGLIPQDLKYKGEPSRLLIGPHNIIREYVTMQPGTEGGGMLTSVGEHCLFMASTHVAHDCHVGNHVIMANNATLAGHVTVEDGAIIGGLSAIHQFVRIGRQAIVGGMCAVKHDVIPYGAVSARDSDLSGLNIVGLKRSGATRKEIERLRLAYDNLFDANDGLFSERLAKVSDDYGTEGHVGELISFIQAETKRSLCLPKS